MDLRKKLRLEVRIGGGVRNEHPKIQLDLRGIRFRFQEFRVYLELDSHEYERYPVWEGYFWRINGESDWQELYEKSTKCLSTKLPKVLTFFAQ